MLGPDGLEQAVIASTLQAATQTSQRTGKVADLAVLSQDIFTAPPSELPKTDSVLTVIGGG